jgi:hypothetical protein
MGKILIKIMINLTVETLQWFTHLQKYYLAFELKWIAFGGVAWYKWIYDFLNWIIIF